MSDETIQDLIFKAHECIENADLIAAMEIGKKILAKDSDNTKGLEIMGYILLEMNCLKEAQFCFSKSIENTANESHVPYLYLGQLSEGEESEKYFFKAIDMMLKNLSNSEKKVLFQPTKLDVSNAYVSLCELYMTDLCDKEDAELRCKEYINKAIEIDETNPASWQSLASLNLIKNEKEAAKASIDKSLNLWLPDAMKIISEAENEECTNEAITTCELSAELRIKCAEILFELEMLAETKSVLDTILIEDDEHFQAHYLAALTLEAQLALLEGNANVAVDANVREELLGAIEDHAEMAVGLANPELEADAVAKMMTLLDKIGVENHDDGNSSSNSSEDEDDSEEDIDEEEMKVDN